MMETAEPHRGRMTRAWVKWALVASLGLNLALAGLIVGAIAKGPPGPPPAGLWSYGRALPEPYRSDLGRALRQSRRDWAGPRDALRGQRDALAAALTADPYDPAAVAAVLAREPRMIDQLVARGSGLLLDQIARMSPQERAAYAQALASRQGQDGGGRRHRAD